MPEEMPQFSSQPLGETMPKKKTVRRRTSPLRSLPRRMVKSEIGDQLSNIYRDDSGRLPDMKKIKVKTKHSLAKNFFGIIILGGFLAAAAWTGFFLLPTADKMTENQIKLSIEGPNNLALGSNNTYTITFENSQKIKIKNATLTVYYPDGFVFGESSLPAKNAGHTEWELGAINAQQKKQLTITGKSYGTLDKETSWRVLLNYQPENFNSVLQKIATLTTKIGRSPITLSISGPEKATVGNEVEYSFQIKQNGDFDIGLMELTPNWPKNFHLTSTTPTMKKNNWDITSTTLATIFKAKGRFSENQNETEKIMATLFLTPRPEEKYEIGSTQLDTTLVKNSLNLSLAINGTMNNFSSQPGKTLNISLNAKNSSSETATKATIKLILEAPSYQKQSILNWTDFVDKHDGLVKGEQINDYIRRGTITWNSNKIASLNEIKTNDEINLDITMPIKDAAKFSLENLKEYTINVAAEISFTDFNNKNQTITSNPVAITLNSDLNLEIKHNTNIMPDNKEEHSVTWVLSNNFHSLKNISLDADIYGDVFWQEPTDIPAGQLKFDPKTKHISWTIPEMPQSIDVLALPMKVTLNKKDPTQNTLMSKPKIVAKDTITGENIELTGEEILLKQ